MLHLIYNLDLTPSLYLVGSRAGDSLHPQGEIEHKKWFEYVQGVA